MSSEAATTRLRFGKEPASAKKMYTAQSKTISQPGCMRWSPSRERDERGWDGAAQQGFTCLPLGGGIEGREKLHLATGKERDRQAAAVEQAVAGQCSEFWPGGQDAGEVEWVRAGE